MMTVIMTMTFMTGFSQNKKVAVVTFYADKQIDFSDVGLTGISVIADLTNNPDFNLAPMLAKYHDKFFNEYAKKFPFELVDETVVTSNEAYKNYKPSFENGSGQFLTSPGYQAINPNWGKDNERAMAKIFQEYDGVMFVFINFQMNKGFGVGGTASTKMKAYTNIVVYNKKAEKVFTINENANSKKTGVMVGGLPVMKVDKILPMVESALDELMIDLDKRIQKIIDKSAKKL